MTTTAGLGSGSTNEIAIGSLKVDLLSWITWAVIGSLLAVPLLVILVCNCRQKTDELDVIAASAAT